MSKAGKFGLKVLCIFILGIIIISSFYSDAYSEITIENYSLNSLLNTARGLDVEGGDESGSGKNLGSDPTYEHGLVALKVKYRSLADTTLTESDLIFINDFDIFEEIDPEILGKVLVYPNPCRQEDGAELGYMLSKNMDIEIQIYDIFGHRIFANTFSSGTPGAFFGYNKLTFNRATLDNFNLSAGVYFIVIIHEGKVLGKTKMAVIP